jgi:DNA-binding PadR family transcriptional regulator
MPASSPPPSPPPSTTGHAILGLLGLRSWTTYELAKQVQRSLRWFWPRAERKLYDEPKRLVSAGLAHASQESTGKRPRTVYSTTDAGRAALRDWLDEPPAPRTTEFEAMVKVFFADAGTLDQLRTTLERIATEAEERLAEVTELAEIWLAEPAFPERAHLGAIGLELVKGQEEAVLQWATWARGQVDEWAATDDPGHWDPDVVFRRLARG